MTNPQDAAVTPERLMQFGFAYSLPLIMGAAVSNKVFDTLTEEAKTIEEVHRATGASVRGLRAIMDVLVALGILTKTEKNKYALTPESRKFLASNAPETLAGFFPFNARRLIPLWLELENIVRTGRPAQALSEQSAGADFYADFAEHIGFMSFGAATALADHLVPAPSTRKKRVLDLGAGSGIWGIALAQKSPGVVVTAVDWRGVIPVAKRFTARFGVQERFTFLEGDLYEVSFGSEYDLAVLGHILHGEGEERSQTLLGKTFGALKSGGTIAIAEPLVNDERTGPLPSLMVAVQVLVNTDHGDVFSYNEITRWLGKIGFVNPRLLDARAGSSVILATKP